MLHLIFASLKLGSIKSKTKNFQRIKSRQRIALNQLAVFEPLVQ